MPRIALLGTASTGSFGFGVGARPATVLITYMLAGGGGQSGAYAGDGGGQVLIGTQTLGTATTYPVTIGAVNSTSVFNGLTAAAGNPASYGTGGSSGNGYGGGNGDNATWPPIPPPPWVDGGYAYAGGGGGGAGGGGGNAYDALPGGYYIWGGDGGPGVVFSLNGNYYGAGAGGQAASYSNTDGPEPDATNGSSGTGYGNYGSANYSGGLIVSYLSILQLFTGGTVTSTGSGVTKRWFHSFPSTSSLAPKYA